MNVNDGYTKHIVTGVTHEKHVLEACQIACEEFARATSESHRWYPPEMVSQCSTQTILGMVGGLQHRLLQMALGILLAMHAQRVLGQVAKAPEGASREDLNEQLLPHVDHCR